VSLTLDPPFVIGDEVSLVQFRGGPETFGRVQRVGLQSTVIQARGRSLVSIPNAVLASSMRIENRSARDRRRLRLSLSVPETLSSKALDKVCVGVKGALEELPVRDPQRHPRVWISGSSGRARLELELWLKPQHRELRWSAEQEAVLAVKTELERQGAHGVSLAAR
jgi:small-conductance mechanosensitive channel